MAGVDVDLIVRGICSLRPGVKGLSERIKVRSIVGRFLEHSRIFHFLNGGSETSETYIGSADWMLRNLDRRVEVVVPIIDREIATYIRDVILEGYLRDNVNAWSLRPDGTYRKVAAGSTRESNSQMSFVGEDILN
ncbi:hypothetical protein JVX88_03015 [Leptolyngbya sp. 7M]|nr:hypothetical protein JVX88_03015 [Leptolyngbya sp. 7M]